MKYLSQLSNIIEEHGRYIDRKLNVAITRARKQLLITGNPDILNSNLIYNKLIAYIKSVNGFNTTAFQVSTDN